MKQKRLWAFLAPVAVTGALYGLVGQGSDQGVSYRFVEVELGTLAQVVASTGTMQATETVEVGTQVSGLLSEIQVDFNDRVTEGQLLARIDPTILEQEVRSAEASLARSQAELDQANRDLIRAGELHERQAISTSELETAQFQYDVAEASLEQSRVAVDRAQRNLEYTEIRAPIDGVVIERAVEVGQTVAASMSAPVLFVLAGDLGEMEILASVDESEIGLISYAQEVQFTVQAYPEDSFRGKVSQVRLQSSMVENVVTYDVVIEVENDDGRLLPGMTATVEFIVAKAEGALVVSNSALRFSPTESMMAELEGNREDRGVDDRRPQLVATGEDPRAEPPADGAYPDSGPRDQNGEAPSHLFYLDEAGRLAVARVRTGITDGQSTVIEGSQIAVGMQVIATVTSGGSAPTTASNPFQSQSSGRPPGGPPR